MGIEKELTRDEELVIHVRTHAKALIWPVLGLLVFTAALGIGLAALPENWEPIGTWVVVGLYAVSVLWVVIWPFLKWFNATYTVTTRRIITRRGVFTKHGHDLPLRRVNNVNSERSVTDRMLGCGTLVLETAAGQPLVLPDVPRVVEVASAVNSILFGTPEGEHDDAHE